MILLNYNYMMKICFLQEPIPDYFEPSNLISVLVIIQKGMKEKAIEFYKRAFALNPDNANAKKKLNELKKN